MFDKIHRRQLDLGPLQHFEPLPKSPVGNQIVVSDGWIKNDEDLVYKAAQLTVGFNIVPAINYVRWDLVYLDLDGNAFVAEGTPNVVGVPVYTGVPAPPKYSYPIAYVFVNEAVNVLVIASDITDIRSHSNFFSVSEHGNEVHNPNMALATDARFPTTTEKAALPGTSGTPGDANRYVTSNDPRNTNARTPLPHGNEAHNPNMALATDTRFPTTDEKAALAGTHGTPSDANRYVTSSDPGFISGSVPAGTILSYAQNSLPVGYLQCNGSAVSRVTYAALFMAIGTIWGGGDGSTTFNLPDFRGEFLRGFDAGRGVDPGRVFASWQEDELKEHSHREMAVTTEGWASGGSSWPIASRARNTSLTGGPETRPRNMAIHYIIKY